METQNSFCSDDNNSDNVHVSWVEVTCKDLTQTYAVHDGLLKADWFVRNSDKIEGLEGKAVRVVKLARRRHYRVLQVL